MRNGLCSCFLVTQLCPTLCNSMDTRLPCPLPSSGACPNRVHWVNDAIQPSRSLSPSSPPAFNLSQHQGLFPRSQFFTSGDQSIGVSASSLVLPMNIQEWFPLDWLVGSPWSTRDCQESSPTPQFKGINSLVLNFLYGPTLTSIYDYWKNHILN